MECKPTQNPGACTQMKACRGHTCGASVHHKGPDEFLALLDQVLVLKDVHEEVVRIGANLCRWTS
jgi:hypothetical protein